VFAKWNFVNYTKRDFANYTTVYHFYNITNSPLGYKSKISVTNFNTISLNRFYGRSIHCRRSAIDINLSVPDYSFLLLLIHGLLGLHIASTRAVAWRFSPRRAGDGSNGPHFAGKPTGLSPKLGQCRRAAAGRAAGRLFGRLFTVKPRSCRGYQVRWLAWLPNHTALNRQLTKKWLLPLPRPP
jgi:hypothetical protein